MDVKTKEAEAEGKQLVPIYRITNKKQEVFNLRD